MRFRSFLPQRRRGHREYLWSPRSQCLCGKIFLILCLFLFLGFLLLQTTKAEYNIEVRPEKQDYEPGEIVKINATIPKASNVTFQVKNPLEITIIVETIETNNSVAILEFQLENDTEEGEYQIFVSAVSEDEKEHASTTRYFNVSIEVVEERNWAPIIIIIVIIGGSGALVAFFRFRY